MQLTRSVLAFSCIAMLAGTLASCNRSNTKPDEPAAAPAKTSYNGPAVTIAASIPFGKNSNASDDVRKECGIQTRVPEFIENEAKSKGIKVVRGAAAPQAKGRVLVMEVAHVLGTGGGAWSGPKSITIDGKLYDNGKLIGSFSAMRLSGGGAFGGYKGTCAILDRCSEALGTDVAEFLLKPVMNAKLGDKS